MRAISKTAVAVELCMISALVAEQNFPSKPCNIQKKSRLKKTTSKVDPVVKTIMR